MNVRRNKTLGCVTGAFMLLAAAPAAVAEGGVSEVPNLTHDETAKLAQAQNLVICTEETERLIALATALYERRGESPEPAEVDKARTIRNARCEKDAGMTVEESAEFDRQMKAKYGVQLPQLLFK